jgi:phosphoribosylamine--glycine ligase
MKFLVIGQGGREHAIVRALNNSRRVQAVHVIPGNPGIAAEASCHSLDWKNFEEISSFSHKNDIDVVVIGPEDPLVLGLSDFLRAEGFLVVGPSKAAAHLEGSKVFAKEFMLENGVATAHAITVRSVEETLAAAASFTLPYVLKADGLAAGKGVVLCNSLEHLRATSQQFFEQKQFGVASEKALLEQFLPGYELSLLLVTNGSDYQLIPLAQDHKQLNDGDQGPNTGGMGTVAPMQISESLQTEIKMKIIDPTLAGLQKREMFYRGIIFLGLMITQEGPQLLEYNCRWGDPETQVVMPLLENDWGDVFHELAQGKLQNLKWNKLFSTCVVLAAPGYPDLPEKGVPIEGDPSYQTANSYFLHAGTKVSNQGQLQTAGGRVLCAMGIGTTKEEARAFAYQQATHVSWRGLQKRADIGLRPLLT